MYIRVLFSAIYIEMFLRIFKFPFMFISSRLPHLLEKDNIQNVSILN